MASDRLQKKMEKRDKLNEEIDKLRVQQRTKKRRTENKRKILAGAAVLDEAEKNPEIKKWLFALLNRFIVRPYERKYFEELVALDAQDDGKQAPKV